MCGASDIASYATHYIAYHIYIYNCEIYTYLYTRFNYSQTLSWKKKTVDLTHTNKLGKIFSYCSPVTIPSVKPLNFQDFTSSGWQRSSRKWFIYVSLLKLQYSFLKKDFHPELIKHSFLLHILTVLQVYYYYYCSAYYFSETQLLWLLLLFYFIYVRNVLLTYIHFPHKLHL